MTCEEQIKEEIEKKNITRLCHFTKSAKLLHILSNEKGIRAIDSLKEHDNDILTCNDQYRFDNHTEYISCSIQYPNTWYLSKVKNQDSLFMDWVIIYVDPYIMCDPKTKFCPRNAAANYGAYIQGGIDGFKKMFAESVQGQRLITRTNRMPMNCTTDGQAEVLIYGSIPRSRILAVAVPTSDQAFIENERLKYIAEASKVKWIVAPDLFNNNWHTLIIRGMVPREIVSNCGER